MKNIELTEGHKSKLLEMCRTLFLKMFVVTIQENGYLNYSDTGKTINYEDRIHWFEFCMTYLLDKLHPDNDKQSKDNWSMDLSDKDYVILKIIVRKKHPVDYLYEAFKKLK